MGNENAAEIGMDEDFVDELKPGTQLMHGQYTIESFLNAGGFGITYMARDSLDRKIVIKECFPGAFCRRSRSIVQARSRAHQKELNSMVRLFVQEAKSLAKLNHPNIVGVHQVFEDNDTTYMALDFVEGRDMLDTLDDPDARMSAEQITSMLKDVLGAVGFIHSQDILHRDISPDNILIDPDGRPVLIDFGAAREEATKQSRVLSALSVVKDGYSPQEFYIAGSEQNASSDLYALGASFYHFISGEVPPNSQARLASIASGEKDPYSPLKGNITGFDNNFLGAIDKALEILPKNRVQSAQEWLDMMEGKAIPSAAAPAPKGPASVAKAVAATAPATESKSKMGILLASAAAVAVIGVGAVMTLGGGDDADASVASTSTTEDTSAPAVADASEVTAQETAAAAEVEAAAQAAAERVAAAEAEAAAVAEAERVAAEAVAAAEEEARLAALEEERIAREAELAAVAAEREAQRVAEEEARQLAEAERVAAEAEAAAQAQAAAEAQALAEQQAAEAQAARELAEAQAAQEAQDAAEAEALALAQAEAEAAQAAAEEAARLAAAEAAEAERKAAAAALAAATLDTPKPPSEINELITLAGTAGAPELPVAAFNANLPVDVALGAVVADDQIQALADGAAVPTGSETPGAPSTVGSDPALPNFVANAPEIGADGFSGLVLPNNTAFFTSVALPLTEAIPAFAPGNEIIAEEPAPTVEESFVLTAWSVELPFSASNSSSRVISSIAPVAPIWVSEGVQIDTVNGNFIPSIDSIDDVLRATVELTDETQLNVEFGVTDENTGGVVQQSWRLPIIQKTALLNGINFETRLVGDEWITTVTQAPADVSGELKVGDQLIAYMRTSERVDQRTSVKSIMDREIAEGNSQFSFAVSREGTMWIASLEYADNAQ